MSFQLKLESMVSKLCNIRHSVFYEDDLGLQYFMELCLFYNGKLYSEWFANGKTCLFLSHADNSVLFLTHDCVAQAHGNQ